MKDFLSDVRFSVRLLGKSRMFTMVAIVTLALSIGFCATLFSWTEGLLLRPLSGVPAQEQIVAVAGVREGGRCCSFSYPNFVDFRDRAKSFEGFFGFRLSPMNLSVSGSPEIIPGMIVSTNYFAVLQVQPQLGRMFRADDDRARSATPIAVIGDRLWRRRFNARPDIIGTTQLLNGRAFTVIGVAPPEFQGTFVGYSIDVWVPAMMAETFIAGPNRFDNRQLDWLEGFARLRADVTREAAQAELDLISHDLQSVFPDSNRGFGLAVYPLWKTPFGAVPVLAPVFAAVGALVGIVLLIACANLANLLLGRALMRGREIALRMALGASRYRVVRQLLTESSLLGLMGGAGGLGVAWWTRDLLPRFVPPAGVPVVLAGQVDLRVLIGTAMISIASVVVFGVLPALRATKRDLSRNLVSESVDFGGASGKSRLQRVLVAAQLAMSLVLLISATLLIQSFRHAQQMRPGFDSDRMLVSTLNLFSTGMDEEHARAFLRRLLEVLRDLPSVTSVSVSRDLPLNVRGVSATEIAIDGYEVQKNEVLSVGFNQVGAHYFDVMGATLLEGREFTDVDDENAEPVCIVNAEMVRRFWSGRSAIGQRVRAFGRSIKVVGVAPTFKYGSLQEKPRPYLYVPVAQLFSERLSIQIRTVAAPEVVAPAFRRAVATLAPQLLLGDVQSMRSFLRFATFGQRVGATLLGVFGVLALFMSTIGLYGVVSCMTIARTREIGLRMALGASRRDVVHEVVGTSAWLVAIGLFFGIALSLLVTRVLSRLLIGVSATDPAIFIIAALTLASIALGAAFPPAWRASQTDPLSSLRGYTL